MILVNSPILGLRFLVHLCQDMGLSYEGYAARLRELEREQEAQSAQYGFNQDV